MFSSSHAVRTLKESLVAVITPSVHIEAKSRRTVVDGERQIYF